MVSDFWVYHGEIDLLIVDHSLQIGSCWWLLIGRDWIEFLSLAEAAIEQGESVLQRANQGVWIGRTGHYRNIRFPETRIIRFVAISKKKESADWLVCGQLGHL